MKTILTILTAIHGAIHLMGFVKAFELAEIKELTLPVSKPFGVLWLLAFLLFIVTCYLIYQKNSQWWIVGILSVFISQLLIFYFWEDAKFGSIANAIILAGVIAGYSSLRFENTYRKDVASTLATIQHRPQEMILESDLARLPAPVQNYLWHTGVVGKPKIKNVKIVFEGEMREKGKDFFRFTSEQYNFFQDPARLFFMRANFKGLPTAGYHRYKNNTAGMHIKLLSLVPVVNMETTADEEMFKTETVTFFNDLCLFAPAALIDPKITWEAIDDHHARAIFTNKGTSIKATLYFNDEGQLINFISEDRSAITPDGLKKYRFSTPASQYKNINGYNLCTYGEATWQYPDGPFVYGKFYVQDVVYNVAE